MVFFYFFKVLNNFMRELDLMGYDIFDVTHSFHLFKETTDFLFNLGNMTDLLNKHGNSVVGFFSNSVAFGHEVFDLNHEMFNSFS